MTLRMPRRPLTLRSRLVISVVALFTLLSLGIGGASVLSLYGNLLVPIDTQLGHIQRIAEGPGGPGGGGFFDTIRGIESGSVVAVSSGTKIVGQVTPNFGGTAKTLTTAQLTPLLSLAAGTPPATVSIAGLGDFRLVKVSVSTSASTTGFEYFALPLAEPNATIARFAATLGGISLAGILLVALATWVIVSYALRPLRRVAATATEVASMPLDRGEVDLSVRVPDGDTDLRTEVGQVGAALNSMLGHVDQALRARQASESRVRQFVADASHELRTPLASIRGYAELTRRGDHALPADVTHSLGRVESEAVRMTSLVEDLLLLARLDEGRELEVAPIDLTRLLVDCVSDAHAAGADHEWRLDVPDDAISVNGDAQRIHQVVANLLANARVHTPAGTTVELALRTEGDDAVISIADDGPGIPDNLQADLFERFARGDSSRTRATGSTGLGLAIVRAVVDAHGGTVSVTSTPGRTVFGVRLPGVTRSS